MDGMLGLLKVKVIKGTNLAIRDFNSSDPYVVVKLGTQSVKTRVISNNLNPVWDEELTLYIPVKPAPLKLRIYDKDTFSRDDKMGDAEVDLQPLTTSAQTLKRPNTNFPTESHICRIQATPENGLVRDSYIKYVNGHVVQSLSLKLTDTESGELEIELKWVELKSK
eukprot:TRINITY_DN36478_c0_g1_i1.p1 TRINITY_DN36478_c0_g1~~TRINITY_DN36478_c0_g1_i1.p1  ORF type:complete len:166 (-),score=28.78 TRINITY_DN36478_c0_g1_i1:171-668(-)